MDCYICWQDDYLAWTERVADTHDSVRYMVGHRLGDWSVAEDVATRVVADMLAKPRVFRYQGLPYAGRIAALAEPLIADPAGAWRAGMPDWAQLTEMMDAMPADLRAVHAATFVHGLEFDEIEATLGISSETVTAMQEEIRARLRGPRAATDMHAD